VDCHNDETLYQNINNSKEKSTNFDEETNKNNQFHSMLLHTCNMGMNHIPIYEGNEDPERNWFFCEKFWTTNNINDEDKKMA